MSLYTETLNNRESEVAFENDRYGSSKVQQQ